MNGGGLAVPKRTSCDVAPLPAVHERVALVATPVAPLAGLGLPACAGGPGSPTLRSSKLTKLPAATLLLMRSKRRRPSVSPAPVMLWSRTPMDTLLKKNSEVLLYGLILTINSSQPPVKV